MKSNQSSSNNLLHKNYFDKFIPGFECTLLLTMESIGVYRCDGAEWYRDKVTGKFYSFATGEEMLVSRRSLL